MQVGFSISSFRGLLHRWAPLSHKPNSCQRSRKPTLGTRSPTQATVIKVHRAPRPSQPFAPATNATSLHPRNWDISKRGEVFGLDYNTWNKKSAPPFPRGSQTALCSSRKAPPSFVSAPFSPTCQWTTTKLHRSVLISVCERATLLFGTDTVGDSIPVL